MLVMQLIASHGWLLQLGDIKGAFLEAGPLPESFKLLFAKQPYGGILGLPEDAVIEVTGNLYGQNDAPSAWHRTFDAEALKCGWERSRFDACLYFLRDPHSHQLCGVIGVHVDDTAVGGQGEQFNKAIQHSNEGFLTGSVVQVKDKFVDLITLSLPRIRPSRLKSGSPKSSDRPQSQSVRSQMTC